MILIAVVLYSSSIGNFIPLWVYLGCLGLSMILTSIIYHFKGDEICE